MSDECEKRMGLLCGLQRIDHEFGHGVVDIHIAVTIEGVERLDELVVWYSDFETIVDGDFEISSGTIIQLLGNSASEVRNGETHILLLG